MKVIIFSPNWLGDLIISQSLIKVLKHSYPHIKIDICAPRSISDAAKRMKEINRVYDINTQSGKFGLFERIKFAGKIKKKYEWAIILPITYKSAISAYLAGIKKRTGFLGEFRYGLINDIVKKEYRLGRKKNLSQQAIYLSIIKTELGQLTDEKRIAIAPKLEVDSQNQKKLLKQFAFNQKKPIISFAMGSNYGLAKQWPIASFQELAVNLIEQGYQILLLGSANEKELAEKFFTDSRIIGAKKNIINTIGKTKLEESIDLLARSHTLVTNDSGLMHVACALGINVQVIYGSSSFEFTPPLIQNQTQVKIFSSDLACSPCFQKTCKFNHYDCLKQTQAKDVFQSIIKMNQIVRNNE